MKYSFLVLSFLLATSNAYADGHAYPKSWWKPVPKHLAKSWEILPQDAGPGEVILSKRTELGMLSNFAETPFRFHNVSYTSLEGFWQMMKYPEGLKDPRAIFPGLEWKFSRQQVSQMKGFEAKDAGSLGSANMKKMGINWVSFEKAQMPYRVSEKGAHFHLIRSAMIEKLEQNPEVKRLLLATAGLVLRPDHHQKPTVSPAWKYFEIWMDIRSGYLKP